MVIPTTRVTVVATCVLPSSRCSSARRSTRPSAHIRHTASAVPEAATTSRLATNNVQRRVGGRRHTLIARRGTVKVATMPIDQRSGNLDDCTLHRFQLSFPNKISAPSARSTFALSWRNPSPLLPELDGMGMIAG